MDTKRDDEGKDWMMHLQAKGCFGYQLPPGTISLTFLRGNQPGSNTWAQASASRIVGQHFWSWSFPAVGYGYISSGKLLWEAQWDSGNRANALLWSGDTAQFSLSLPSVHSLQLETAHHQCPKAAKHGWKSGAGLCCWEVDLQSSFYTSRLPPVS